MVLDFDGIGAEGIKYEIENTKYANRCISPEVKGCEERDIGEWSDDHPLNHRDKSDAEYNRLFAPNAPAHPLAVASRGEAGCSRIQKGG
jgi:hypothetical protein